MATIDGRTLDHKTLEHIRRLAVKRVLEDGEAPSEVMRSFGLCRTTIYRWLQRFEEQGTEALGPVQELIPICGRTESVIPGGKYTVAFNLDFAHLLG